MFPNKYPDSEIEDIKSALQTIMKELKYLITNVILKFNNKIRSGHIDKISATSYHI